MAYAAGYFRLDEVNDRDYLVWGDEKVEAWDRLQVAEEYLQAGSDEMRPLRITSV